MARRQTPSALWSVAVRSGQGVHDPSAGRHGCMTYALQKASATMAGSSQWSGQLRGATSLSHISLRFNRLMSPFDGATRVISILREET